MPINHDALMRHHLPDVHQQVTPRDTILYALSVGFGQDPMDPRQLDFVDHHRALRAVPTAAVVLGHPGFWVADPATGIDAVQVVHGEQGIVLHRPLPVGGAVVGRTRVTGLVDKGPGRGALLYSEKLLLDDAGTLLATLTSTTVLRGDGGFGGPSGPMRQPHPLPDGPPDWTMDLPTRPEQALLYRLERRRQSAARRPGDCRPRRLSPADPARAMHPGRRRPCAAGEARRL